MKQRPSLARAIVAIGFVLALAVPPAAPLAAQQPGDGADPPVPLELGTLVDRTLGLGEVHDYVVDLEAGSFFHAVVEQAGRGVAVALYGPDGGKLAEAGNSLWSDETLTVEVPRQGRYRLELRQQGRLSPMGRYELRAGVRTAVEQQAWAAERRRAADAARDWIREHAIPLATVEAGHGFADLEPIRDIVGDARIVALGEATHGTREFFQLKHRMLEFLVSELGFDIFAIEASLPEAIAVNRYVLTGEGDPARALAGMYFWIWDTEEVLELIRWMRRYNEDPRHTRKVRFYGVDMQYAARPARVVLEYLERVDPPAAAAAEAVLGPLTDPYLPRDAALLAPVRELAAAFDRRAPDYGARTPADELDLVRRHLHVIEQALAMNAAGARAGIARDSAMAANLEWALEREGAGSKAVLWAHNGHVAMWEGVTGGFLRRSHGDALRVFGFVFDRGEFQALDQRNFGNLRAFRVDAAPEGSLDAQLAAAGLQVAALDLRRVPAEGAAASWFATARPTRSFIGSGYFDGTDGYWWRERATSIYDALFFIAETSAARATPTGRRPVLPRLTAPANPGFEEGEPGEPPPGWAPRDGIAGVEWEAILSRDGAHSGRQSAVIRRAAPAGYSETYGELRQRVNASAWRGQRLTFSAAVRLEPTTPASRAYLWIQLQNGLSQLIIQRSTADSPITAPEWREYELEIDVPEDAESVWYGIVVVGPGPAWVDTVRLRTP
jgi:erythromycin esterase